MNNKRDQATERSGARAQRVYECNCEEGKKAEGFSDSKCANPAVYFEVDDFICKYCGYYTRLYTNEADRKKEKEEELIEYSVNITYDDNGEE